MTTEEMIRQSKDRRVSISSEKHVSYLTSNKELSVPREKMNLLKKKIADDVNQMIYERRWPLARAYAYFDEHCHIAAPTMKKALQENGKITRKFLYKYTVGMHMSIDQAQEYFDLQGRILQSESDAEDIIAYNALKDGDSTYSMIEEFWRYLKISL